MVIGIPVRYIHDHAGLAHLDDYRHALELVFTLVKTLDGEALAQLHDNL